MARQKLLFICTANIARSKTAEDLMKSSSEYETKSAGFKVVSERSGQLVTQELISWADRIFVMDEKNDNHLTLLCEGFDIRGKEIVVLGIPDIYGRGDKLLAAILKMELLDHGVAID